MDRQNELITLLTKANQAYYTDNHEIMSDKAYDALYDELVVIEKQTSVILANSPTQKVGHQILPHLNKVTHPQPLLSLDKTKEVDKLVSFLKDQQGILSFKLDGLTILLHYEGGELVQAVTRGTGSVGEEVTHNARHFYQVPQKIPYQGKLSVRGEATISYKDFEAINEGLDEKYKNPRNLCSGTVRQLDSQILAKRKVNFFAFAIMAVEETFGLKSEQLTFLKENGFTTVAYEVVSDTTVTQQVEAYKEKVDEVGLPTDGLVLTLDDIKYSERLGSTAKFPRDAIAFKWQDQEAITKLIAIEWNTSRTGAINPIAIFEPVDLEGTEVKRASLHNVSILEELALGIGDEISVYKANMIIPQVAENLTKSGAERPPSQCKECLGETQIKSDKGVKTLHCMNPMCKAQQLKALSHYVSRNALNIDGLSEGTLEKFIKKGFVANYGDLYTLEKHQKKMVALEGFGQKSYDNMIKAIEASKNTSLDRFIYGLGISGIGTATAKLLCNHLDQDIEKIKATSVEALVEVDGVGEITASNVVQYFANPEHVALIDQVLSQLNFEKKTLTNTSMSGLTFVATGSVALFKNRKEIQSLIEERGGKLAGAVSKKTNYLINNDKESGSAKNKNASKLGIPIISEEEFANLFELFRQ